MVDASWMAGTVQDALPEAEVHATDIGGGDHWHVVVVDDTFAGMRPLERQRTVLGAFKAALADGSVHALDLNCLTQAELEDRHGGAPPKPFIPHQAGEGSHPAAWSAGA